MENTTTLIEELARTRDELRHANDKVAALTAQNFLLSNRITKMEQERYHNWDELLRACWARVKQAPFSELKEDAITRCSTLIGHIARHNHCFEEQAIIRQDAVDLMIAGIEMLFLHSDTGKQAEEMFDHCTQRLQDRIAAYQRRIKGN